LPRIRIERLTSEHDRSGFQCGTPDLDDYLTKYCNQDGKRNYARTFVLTENGSPKVLGYYTLSAGSILFEELPEDVRKKLPRYPMPVAHLGRMAVDQAQQGRKFGTFLLMDALKRALEISEHLAIAAVEVVAKNERVRAFYLHHEFVELTDDPLHMYLPMATIRALFP
jgi:GNAT superfamily N-acetyltransferase